MKMPSLSLLSFFFQATNLQLDMTAIPKATLFLVFVGATMIAACSAFVATPARYTSIAKPERQHLSTLYAEENDDVIDKALESLPSPDTIMDNVMDGKFGERGEQYVILQFGLFLFIAIGNVPIIGDTLFTLLGPLLILTGLVAVYKAAADLKDNLSPWPVPTDPESGRGSLVNSGIYSYVRYPMYTGVLLGMAGLSVITDSVIRLLLTCTLYYVLDIKSDYEEQKLAETYGGDYEKYKQDVTEKFFPADLTKVFE